MSHAFLIHGPLSGLIPVFCALLTGLWMGLRGPLRRVPPVYAAGMAAPVDLTPVVITLEAIDCTPGAAFEDMPSGTAGSVLPPATPPRTPLLALPAPAPVPPIAPAPHVEPSPPAPCAVADLVATAQPTVEEPLRLKIGLPAVIPPKPKAAPKPRRPAARPLPPLPSVPARSRFGLKAKSATLWR